MVSMYQQITPVLFGPGAIKEIGNKAKEFGSRKALCVYDESIGKTGIAKRIVDLLKEAEIEVSEYGNVISDAPDTTINEVGEKIYKRGYDLIIGIGGGSSLDTAKSIAVLAENSAPINQHFTTNGGGMFRGKDTMLILVPTASGTGSEVTPISVVHDTKRNVKDTILRIAELSILDPELTISCPKSVTAATAMDAFSHALEAFTSNGANMMTDFQSKEAMKLIYNNVETAVENGADINARTNLAFASNIAGIAFADASVHAGHCAAHEVGIQLNLPHGVVCALSAPAVIEYFADTNPGKMLELAELLDCNLPEGADDKTAATAAADAIRALNRRIGIKSFKEMGFSKEQLLSCADGAVNNNWFVIKSPKPVGIPQMKELMEIMYDKY